MRTLKVLLLVVVLAHAVEMADRSGLAGDSAAVATSAQAVRDLTSALTEFDVGVPPPFDDFVDGARPIVTAFDDVADALD